MKANELSIGWAMKQKDPVAALQRVIDNIRTWADRPSETFTALCGTEGDRFTHGEVTLFLMEHGYALVRDDDRLVWAAL